MSEGLEHRDTENNWVIPNTEGLPVETVGAGHGEPPPSHEEATPPGAEAATIPSTAGGTEPPGGAAEVKGPEASPPFTETPPHQEQLEIPPETPGDSPEEEREPLTPPPRSVGADLEEVSCSSSDDDVEGLRKRAGRGGAAPPSSLGPAPRDAAPYPEDGSASLNLNKFVIAAIALVGLAVLVFTGGFGDDDDDLPQTVLTRSVGGDGQPETIADIQEWFQQHADQFSGDPSSLQVMSHLLDKVAKENQEIRHMEAQLQAQKEELAVLLQAADGKEVTTEPQPTRIAEENVRLKEALLREETSHLSAKEELQNLREKLEALEADTLEKEALLVENTQLKVELESSRVQMESFLTQKETLVAESQMLRQELDKQRQLVASIWQDLDGMTANKTEQEGGAGLPERVADMSKRLSMEAQRSETWEKKYGEHAQKRKELVEERKPFGHKEWKKGDKWGKFSNATVPEGQFKKPHFRHSKEHGRRREEEEARGSPHEEWKSKKHEDKEKKHRHWEGGKSWTEDKDNRREKDSENRKDKDSENRKDKESGNWKDKGKEHKWKDSHHRHENGDRTWKDQHARHQGEDFHPRKGQREFSKDKRQEHGKEHRHHEHNKFWKKLSDHQYRVPEGCSGLEDCARKDGVDLFNVELKPVERKQFEEVLKAYLAQTELSKNLPELLPLLDGFFQGPYFAHHNIRFKDFVDDVEDFLEDLAKKETGSDDLAEDFERFVYISFFGEAASKKRSL